MKLKLKTLGLALAATTLSTLSFADESSPHSFSANVGAVSSYVVRGLTDTKDNENVALQGGIDYEHASGFYAGYWTSTLGDAYPDATLESDFYAGYNGSFTEDFGYTVGGTYYYYNDTDDLDGFETLLGLNYKDFSISAQTLVADLAWGNAGDTYLLASYSYPLPKDFTLNTSIGAYYYSDSGDFEGNTLDTTETFGFRHATVGVSKPIADTGASFNLDYIFGGYDRSDNKHGNTLVFGFNFAF
jgi:uncharacterized protein (TIGR02001 family)